MFRANFGIFSARQNMLTQVGSVTTNGLQQQTIFLQTDLHRQFGLPMPVWPGVVAPTPVAEGAFPLFSGVRVFHRDYKNPRIYSFNVSYEQQLAPDWAGYVDFIWTKGTNLSRFLNYNRSGPVCCDVSQANGGTGNVMAYTGAPPWDPALGEVMVATSFGHSLYRGLTLGVRKRLAKGYQLEANYVLAKDEDDDSNERDPFTDRSFNFLDLDRDYGLSDRDIRHKFNLFGFFELPASLNLNTRVQARTAQPITPSPRVENGNDRGRNSTRKDNRVLQLRLAVDAIVQGRRALRDHPHGGDVQHVQQREQPQPAEHAGAVRFLRVPADRCRGPATVAAGGQVHVLEKRARRRAWRARRQPRGVEWPHV